MAEFRIEFEVWLTERHKENFSPTFCVTTIDEASRYAVEKSVSKRELFEISDYRMFNELQNKLLSNKIFRITHKRTYKAFEKVGQLYSQFLKSLAEAAAANRDVAEKQVPIIQEKACDKSKITFERTMIDLAKSIAEFQPWFIEQGKAISTANSYGNSLVSVISRFNKEWAQVTIENNLPESVSCYIALLNNNPLYIDANKVAHNSYSAALKAFERFLNDRTFKDSDDNISSWANKMTISEAIIEVLKEKAPLSSGQIYDEIIVRNLYKFGAQNPQGVVAYTIRHHCVELNTVKNSSTKRYFKIFDESENKTLYALVDEKATVSKDVQKVENLAERKSDGGIIDLNKDINVEFTKPTQIIFYDKKVEVRTWKELMIATVNYLIEQFPEKAVTKFKWNKSRRNVFAVDKSDLVSPRQIVNGIFIETNYSGSSILSFIKAILCHYGVDLSQIEIMFRNTKSGDGDSMVSELAVDKIVCIRPDKNVSNLLKKTEDIFACEYKSGFAFTTTAIRLLSERIGIQISDEIVKTLKDSMFRREDDLYFWPTVIAADDVISEIGNLSRSWLNEFECFEIAKLYEVFNFKNYGTAIRNIGDFADYYAHMTTLNIRDYSSWNYKIIALPGNKKWQIEQKLARRLQNAITENGGIISELELTEQFPVLSLGLICELLKYYEKTVIRNEINDVSCFQSLDALGLPDDFSEILKEVIEELEEVGLSITEESIHTALSLRLKVNFRMEFNLQNSKTYRQFISAYYEIAFHNDSAHINREWNKGVFSVSKGGN